MDNQQNEYHILSLSGGKDSTALAFFIKDNMPEVHEKIEYVFFDTECEIPETYDYLNKIEMFLNKPVQRIKPYKSFEDFYLIYKLLPSIRYRWCTIEMKTKTFRKYINERVAKGCKINVYVGIRADEPSRVNHSYDSDLVMQQYPFVENSVTKSDVHDILNKNSIGIPEYYKWRSRSGCYFCFFQRKIEWVGLYERHHDLFQKAVEYEERGSVERGKNFTWCQDMSLKELIKPENIRRIKKSYENKKIQKTTDVSNFLLDDLFDDEESNKCAFCHS